MSKSYVVRRVGGEVMATVRTGTEERPLRHIAYHSPTGLDLGYPGSGPADLALSILVDHLGEGSRWRQAEGEERPPRVPRGSRAWDLHQDFKRRFIASADRSGLVLREDEIGQWIEEHSHELAGDEGVTH
jgi:hypothetical protein